MAGEMIESQPLTGHDKNGRMVCDHYTNTDDLLRKWLRGY